MLKYLSELFAYAFAPAFVTPDGFVIKAEKPELPDMSILFKGGSKSPSVQAAPAPAPLPAPAPPEKSQSSLKINEADPLQKNRGRASLRIKRSDAANIDQSNSGVNLPVGE